MNLQPVGLVVVAAVIGVGAPLMAVQELPRGQIIDDVKCLADPSQGYALYLPSTYSADRTWPLLMGFHPGARGRAIVEKYRAAAEHYGYVVAGSNNSRNGAWAASGASVQAMTTDIGGRFNIDGRRFYLTGHSGGARVAMQVALGSTKIAGVIASSAGFPDSQPRSSVRFSIFGTAGSEDFNYIEMRLLDRALKTPHRVVIFDGGHTLPPDDIALEAIEWMELQAIKAGTRSKDDTLIDRLLAKRQQQVATSGETAATVHLLDGLVQDFKGLRDVTAAAARASDLRKQSAIKKALSRERANDDDEARTLGEVQLIEASLTDDNRRREALSDMRDLLTRLGRAANAAADSPERRQARRVLRTITLGAAERVQDPEYLRLLEPYRQIR